MITLLLSDENLSNKFNKLKDFIKFKDDYEDFKNLNIL
jgi:hypothetical protein